MIRCIDIGTTSYIQALKLQEETREKRLSEEICDTVFFCEHEPVYTTGKRDCSQDFLASSEVIKSNGIDIVGVERGGRITYHGPGQLVVYFIMKVTDHAAGVKEFVAMVEDILIATLMEYGLRGVRKKEYPGIWIADKKIAAIGFNIHKGVSMHGIALNIDTDLDHYRYIVPCGIKKFGITSMRRELDGKTPQIKAVTDSFIRKISDIFNATVKCS